MSSKVIFKIFMIYYGEMSGQMHASKGKGDLSEHLTRTSITSLIPYKYFMLKHFS